MVFVRGRYEPLLSSNYNALSSLKHLTPSQLWNNTAFKLSFFLIAVFSILLVLDQISERALSTKQKVALLMGELQQAHASQRYFISDHKSHQTLADTLSTQERRKEVPACL